MTSQASSMIPAEKNMGNMSTDLLHLCRRRCRLSLAAPVPVKLINVICIGGVVTSVAA